MRRMAPWNDSAYAGSSPFEAYGRLGQNALDKIVAVPTVWRGFCMAIVTCRERGNTDRIQFYLLEWVAGGLGPAHKVR